MPSHVAVANNWMYAADLIYFYHMGLLWYSNFMEFNESASTITTIDVYY